MSRQDPDPQILSYQTPEARKGWRQKLDAPAILDLGAVASVISLVVSVEMFGAGGTDTTWWIWDWQSMALFCFYRVLEALIAGLPISAMIIRIIRYFTGRSIRGCVKWIALLLSLLLFFGSLLSLIRLGVTFDSLR